MCRHDLHAQPGSADRNRRVFDQIREYPTVETQGRRDPAHTLSSQEHRHKWSRLADANDPQRGKRFTQNMNDTA